MRIEFTPDAANRIASEFPEGVIRLKLLYDTEGCGCVMSGVPTLVAIHHPDEGDERAESESFEVWYEKRYEVFFEDSLKIDSRQGSASYVLKSDNQTYTTNMRLLKANLI